MTAREAFAFGASRACSCAKAGEGLVINMGPVGPHIIVVYIPFVIVYRWAFCVEDVHRGRNVQLMASVDDNEEIHVDSSA